MEPGTVGWEQRRAEKAEARVAELEAENKIMSASIAELRAELGRIADHATAHRRMAARDLAKLQE